MEVCMTILQQASHLQSKERKFDYQEFKKLWEQEIQLHPEKRKYRKPVYTE